MKYHSYIFFGVDKTIHTLSQKTITSYKKEFQKVLLKEKQVITYSYTLLGLKGSIVFLLWFQADAIETIQHCLNALLHTSLGAHLSVVHTLFGMTRQTQYSVGSTQHIDTNRKGRRYLVIYPFTKTQEWYFLSAEKRKTLMKGHIVIGRKYPQIAQLLLYSYGVDDTEFIVSYETDDLSHFQSLVMELRSDNVRAYTQKDTPIFTCVYRSIQDTLTFL